MAEFNNNNFKGTASVNWIPISLTCNSYPEGDLVGQLLAWCSLLPIFVGVGLFTLILFRRDVHTICFTVGLILNEFFNVALKYVIRQERFGSTSGMVAPALSGEGIGVGGDSPVSGSPALGDADDMRRSQVLREVHTKYGMPSSHAQFFGFFSLYFLLFLFFRLHRNFRWLDELWKYVVALIIIATGIAVCISRVYLGYHTRAQVLCGAAVGAGAGLIWFLLVHLVLSPYFPIIANWPFCELLQIRDFSLIPNCLWFEYTSARHTARMRYRKMS